jgi:type IV pilus assembly protein PilA
MELMIVVAIIAILAAIGIPNMLRARMSGNEASAIGALRAINSGQAAYSSSCASGGYAQTLEDLVKAPTAGGQGFISIDLNTTGVTKSGYVLTMEPGSTAIDVGSIAASCNAPAAIPNSDYWAKADPVTINGTGTRYFATDSRGTIFGQMTAAFVNPIPANALAVQ